MIVATTIEARPNIVPLKALTFDASSIEVLPIASIKHTWVKTIAEKALVKFKHLNNSHKTKLIWHFGSGWGFYSELNSLLFATLYCLQNRIRIEVYSKDATFCFGNGWKEYFQPIFPEYNNNFIGKRINQGYNNFSHNNKYLFLYKILTKNFVGNDIFWFCRSSWFEHLNFNIPELGINGDIREAMKVIIPIIYRFNPNYDDMINERINNLKLPNNYISIHVRAGDKKRERNLIPPQEYINKAVSNSDCKNVFVATDDYRIFEKLKKDNPTYTFYTLTSPNETGYDNDTFFSSSKENIRSNLVEMFASIRIILQSKLFVGTRSSNPGLFIGMQLSDDKMIGMDFEHWLII